MIKLSRSDSDLLKGLGILMLLFHHAFGFPERIPGYLEGQAPYSGLVSAAQFLKICVPLFLFVSGYGMAKKRIGKFRDLLTRAKSLYLSFWFYVLIGAVSVVIHTLITGKTHLPKDYWISSLPFTDFLGLTSAMCPEWWFFSLYLLMLLLIFPLQKLAAFPKYIIAVSIGLVLVARHIPEFSVVGISSAALLRWQFGFVSGYSLALMSEFDVGGILRMVRMPIAVCTIGAIYLIHKSLGGTVALLLLPFFVWGLKIIFENMPYRNMLEFLGKKSMPMWLLHPFIVYYIFAEQLFSLSNALVIYLALVFGTIIIALPLEWGRIRLINQENDSINTIRKGAA